MVCVRFPAYAAVTQAFLETVYRVTDSLSSDYNATLMGQPNIKKDAKRQSPIRLVNNTGCTYVCLSEGEGRLEWL